MNMGKTVFAQILEHLPLYEFKKYVEKYNGNRRVRKFSCYDQFLCLAFAQITYRESLRDIETCLNSHHEKLYHIGFLGERRGNCHGSWLCRLFKALCDEPISGILRNLRPEQSSLPAPLFPKICQYSFEKISTRSSGR